MTAVSEQISDYRGFDLPLDQPDESSFLHFVTGSLPAKIFAKLEIGENAALLPLAERDGRQILIAMTTRQGRPDLDRALQQAGFQPEKLPVVAGTTTAILSEQNQREQEQVAVELKELNAKLQALAENSRRFGRRLKSMATTERRLLEAEQNFPRTENALLVTGWIPKRRCFGFETANSRNHQRTLHHRNHTGGKIDGGGNSGPVAAAAPAAAVSRCWSRLTVCRDTANWNRRCSSPSVIS